MSGPVSQRARDWARAYLLGGVLYFNEGDLAQAFARFEAEVTAPLLAENERLREIIERAQQCVPPGYVNWHFAARAALEGGCDGQG